MPTPEQSTEPALEEVLRRLAAGEPLDRDVIEAAFVVVMVGSASHASLAALLSGLRSRGESAPVLVGVVAAMRGVMTRFDPPSRDYLIDTCGTGGGRLGTLNISTAAAFVAAGAGVPVAKHGNRSFTSKCGSADVLEALGIATHVNETDAARVLEEAGIVFLFAPNFHPAMRHLAAVRRELGVATVMNLAGPLANPALPERQVVGVADPANGPVVAEALLQLGCVRATVVHGEIGLDEVSPVGQSRVWELREGTILESRFDPREWGFATSDMRGTEAGTPSENAHAIKRLFQHPSQADAALRAAVLLNAAMAIEVSGMVADFETATRLATDSLEGGAAFERLARLQELAPFKTSG